jgi:hypothetical protein
VFKKLKVRIKKEEPKYEFPDKPMSEWTIKEIKEICHFYSRNHDRCPFHDYDPYGVAACTLKISLWGCHD